MFEFFDNIISFISAAVSYVLNFFKQLLQLFANIGKALIQINTVTAYLPPYVQGFVLSLIFVGIVYFLLNRD